MFQKFDILQFSHIPVCERKKEENHLQYELACKQQIASSGLMSFELNVNPEKAKHFYSTLSLFRMGVSWGGLESCEELIKDLSNTLLIIK